ncbi:hypothetical protein [Streptomyces sp. ISL-10]|nr:hypothetical protein [Streptomyces sp. ISL-10]
MIDDEVIRAAVQFLETVLATRTKYRGRSTGRPMVSLWRTGVGD